jgi:hypothetical protein
VLYYPRSGGLSWERKRAAKKTTKKAKKKATSNKESGA